MQVILATTEIEGIEAFKQFLSAHGFPVVREFRYATIDTVNEIAGTPAEVIFVSSELPLHGLTILEFVEAIREHVPALRVVFHATEQLPGDPLLSDLVGLGVYDILLSTNDDSFGKDLLEVLRQPRTFKDVKHLRVPASGTGNGPGAGTEVKPSASLPGILPSGRGRRVIVFARLGHAVGISFLSFSLAAVLAELGRKTLLIDADEKERGLSAFFGNGGPEASRDITLLRAVSSLKDLLAGATYNETLKRLWVLGMPVTDSKPPGLTHEDFAQLLGLVGDQLDYIVIDAGLPVSTFTTAALSLADSSYLVFDHDLNRTAAAVRDSRGVWDGLRVPRFKWSLVFNRHDPLHDQDVHHQLKNYLSKYLSLDPSVAVLEVPDIGAYAPRFTNKEELSLLRLKAQPKDDEERRLYDFREALLALAGEKVSVASSGNLWARLFRKGR